MKTFSVLGSGCAKCKRTAELITQTAEKLGVPVQVEKDTTLESLMKYQVMSTPGVVENGVLLHSGGLPSQKRIEEWLTTP